MTSYKLQPKRRAECSGTQRKSSLLLGNMGMMCLSSIPHSADCAFSTNLRGSSWKDREVADWQRREERLSARSAGTRVKTALRSIENVAASSDIIVFPRDLLQRPTDTRFNSQQIRRSNFPCFISG